MRGLRGIRRREEPPLAPAAPSGIAVSDKALIASLQRDVAARDRTIALMEKERAQGPAPGAGAAVDAPAPPRGRTDVPTVEEALRETNQRLRAHLRAAEAMIALRDGVSVDELAVPWPKQTPSRAATRA
jgi:hypothetical protein